MSILPESKRGRRNADQERQYQDQLQEFADLILNIDSRLDFRVSGRGWCYQLEEHGLGKGDFDKAQRLINHCRKAGLLPLDICADDDARVAVHLDDATAWENDTSVEEYAQIELERIESAREDAIRWAGSGYSPFDFWYDKDVYLEMLVEKIDLKELFRGICSRFRIPISNARGWPDINSRATMMKRFKDMEDMGKTPILLYCGDHDPAGLNISGSLRDMFSDLSAAVNWSPDNLIIDRFGLNFDFIEDNNLSWIDGLETSSGLRLDSPRHPDHDKPYVRDYLNKYGARKVEANALVTRAEAGRKLCLDSVCKYIDEDAPDRYQAEVSEASRRVRDLVHHYLDVGGAVDA